MNDLANPPLVQAVFEVKWSLDAHHLDPGYPLFIGPLRGSSPRFQEATRLAAAELPETSAAHMPTFRLGAKRGPSAFVGPGIAACVCNTDYTWDDYRAAAQEMMSGLSSTYREQVGSAPVFDSMSLRYTNEVTLEEGDAFLEFLREKLHIELTLPDGIAKHEAVEDDAVGFFLRVGLPVSTPDAAASLEVASRFDNGVPSIRWIVDVFALEPLVPQSIDETMPWLEAAHRIVEDWFETTVDGELRARFEEGVSNAE